MNYLCHYYPTLAKLYIHLYGLESVSRHATKVYQILAAYELRRS